MQPALRPVIMALAALLAQFTLACGRSSDPASARSELSPDRWPQHDRDRYLALQGLSYSDAAKRLQQSAVSAKGMVAGTSDPFAVHAGLEILKRGGSAADAALTTALTQVALTAGGTISYAGTMTVVYYDASTAWTYTLNAAYQTVQQESDPGTIPGVGSHGGRTALVPGFMAGVQALHDRFGRLPTNREMSPLFSTRATATAGDRQGFLWTVSPSLIPRVFSSSRSQVPALVSACQTPRTR